MFSQYLLTFTLTGTSAKCFCGNFSGFANKISTWVRRT